MPKNKQKEIVAKIALEYKRAQDYKQQAQSKWQEVKELIERLIYEATESQVPESPGFPVMKRRRSRKNASTR